MLFQFYPSKGKPLYKMHWLHKIQGTERENNGQEGSRSGGCTLKQAFRTSLVSPSIAWGLLNIVVVFCGFTLH